MLESAKECGSLRGYTIHCWGLPFLLFWWGWESKADRDLQVPTLFITESTGKLSLSVDANAMAGSSLSMESRCTKNYQYWLDIYGDEALFVII